jgi:integrase
MGYINKNKKGKVSITSHRGRIMLRWRHEGIRYSLSLPYDYSPENMHHATLKVAEIKLDVMKCCFDTTLEKYKPPKPVKVKPIATLAIIEEAKPVFLNDLVQKFNHWGNNIRNIDVENSIDYLYTRKLLEKWIDIPIDKIAETTCRELLNVAILYRHFFSEWI